MNQRERYTDGYCINFQPQFDNKNINFIIQRTNLAYKLFVEIRLEFVGSRFIH